MSWPPSVLDFGSPDFSADLARVADGEHVQHPIQPGGQTQEVYRVPEDAESTAGAAGVAPRPGGLRRAPRDTGSSPVAGLPLESQPDEVLWRWMRWLWG